MSITSEASTSFCAMAAATQAIILLFFPLLFSLCSSVSSTVVLPVVKDAATEQYVTTFRHKTPLLADTFVVDLGGTYLWIDCNSGYSSSTRRPVGCNTSACTGVGSGVCGDNTCGAMPENVFIKTSVMGDLYDDALELKSTDGTLTTVPHFIFACGSTSLLSGLAAGTKGMLGLGRSVVGVPTQVATEFKFAKKFALCLPSSSTSNGGIFFGNSPYLIDTVDYAKFLSYTKLLINPVSTAGVFTTGQRSVEYFVKVNSITVSGKAVPLNTTLLDLHEGNGGTKISTVDKYTQLESSIFKAVTSAFVQEAAAKGIKQVAATKSFTTCFSTQSLSTLYYGYDVPEIELKLEGASTGWKFFGSNSIVDVGNGVSCLAVVDNGASSRTSIVIGAYQLQNTLVEFDIDNNKFGFGPTLFFRKVTCAGFKFK